MSDPTQIELKPDSNTIKTPEDFALDLTKSGTDNNLNLDQTWAGEMTNLLGDGVLGPEAPNLSGSDNEIAQQEEADEDAYNSRASMVPRP